MTRADSIFAGVGAFMIGLFIFGIAQGTREMRERRERHHGTPAAATPHSAFARSMVDALEFVERDNQCYGVNTVHKQIVAVEMRSCR